MHTSIDELYRIFHLYRLGDDFFGSSFGVSHADYRVLTSKPLIELDVIDVEHYVSRALTIWGNVGHFKHFLPRLMQLTTDQYLSFERPNAVFSKLELARWKGWPAEERKAVGRSLMHFWERQLASPGDFPVDERIESALHGLRQACGCVRPFLDRWLTIDDRCAALHLGQVARYISSDSADDDNRRRLGGVADAVRDEMSGWLIADSATEYLNRYQGAVDRFFPNVIDQMRAHEQRRIDDAVNRPAASAARPTRMPSQPRVGRA
jgi:hypothetical protein